MTRFIVDDHRTAVWRPLAMKRTQHVGLLLPTASYAFPIWTVRRHPGAISKGRAVDLERVQPRASNRSSFYLQRTARRVQIDLGLWWSAGNSGGGDMPLPASERFSVQWNIVRILNRFRLDPVQTDTNLLRCAGLPDAESQIIPTTPPNPSRCSVFHRRACRRGTSPRSCALGPEMEGQLSCLACQWRR